MNSMESMPSTKISRTLSSFLVCNFISISNVFMQILMSPSGCLATMSRIRSSGSTPSFIRINSRTIRSKLGVFNRKFFHLCANSFDFDRLS
ncbi:hypothetical protein NY2A_b572R [Paramecium bursaria Chlorella virus NY2A]|uniref:Uncharacterized protein b572R n=1 Tax=Paramecium bursaria Chlorella virus NY2A TaxID=46021 RepID=A7IX97_PBCVN|nr:hypothetical protein NY2A_b572R [Paramecium bursaria Chlorella virus NY2A]ABT14971.1 hypothetical protein NY2A_b572R [Paramecium bursaria Chlorella virus NY2A]